MVTTDPLTVFCDIDGTILKYDPKVIAGDSTAKPVVLAGTITKIKSWRDRGIKVILLSARPTMSRSAIERQLYNLKIPYDQLVVNIGTGLRVLIDNTKPDGTKTTKHFCMDRDRGISEINI